MATPIGSLHAALSAGHAQFASDMGKAKRAVQTNATGMQRAMGVVRDRFNSAAKAMLSFRGIMTSAAMVAGMVYAVKKQLEYADTIAKTADKIGITTKALQKYRYIADRSGVATNKLDSGFEAFSKRLGELRMGTGTLYTILNKNNQALKAQLVAADNTTEALDIYFDALKNTENQNDRAALSAAAFGRQAGVGMTLMVDQIDVLSKRFERLGVEIDEKLLRESEAAKDNIDDLGLVVRNSLNRALIAMGPSLGQIAADMATWVAKNKEFIGQDIPDKIRDMAEATKDFTDSTAFKAMVEYWELAAGAAVGFKLGGPTGALIGAGAGGYISAFKDIREMTKKELPEALKKAQQELQILQEEMLRAEKGKGLYSVAYLNKEISQTESRIADMERRLTEATAATEKKAPSGTVDTTDVDEGTDAVQNQIEALKTQRDTIGKTSDEVALYHLRMQGATDGQLEMAASILETIAAEREKLATTRETSQGIVNSWIAEDEMRRASIEGTKESIEAYNELKESQAEAIQSMLDKMLSFQEEGKKDTTALTEFQIKAFRSMQSAMSDLFFKPWDDGMDGFVQKFADTMQRVAADWLATQAMMGLFGKEFGSGGDIGGLIGSIAKILGGMTPHAKGGIVDGPIVFPMAQGAGLMGEAGPEAILPLTRTSSGNLGVETSGGDTAEPQTVTNYFVISSPDAEGFDRLCQRNAISIVKATNTALEKNVGRKQMRGLLGG
jgi:hypothetical protein